MHRAKTLSALAIALAALGFGGMKLGSKADAAPALSPLRAAAAALTVTRAPGARALEQRYTLDYRHQLRIEGRALQPTIVKGIWTTETPLDGRADRVGVTLGDLQVSGRNDAPPAEDMLARFEIEKDASGRLDRLGFGAETPAKARGLLGTLASAFWFTPGEGERWIVEEQDRTGRYLAVYERRGPGEVVRTRERFTALRGKKGLDSARADEVSATGETRFRFDEQGIREIVVDEQLSMKMLDGKAPAIVVHVEATLRRTESREIARGRREPLPLEDLRAHGQADDSSRRNIEIARLGGAGVREVLAEVAKVESIPRHDKAEATWRTGALLETRALLRVKPESAAAVAKAVEESAGGDPRVTGVLVGALGEAGTKEADEELVRLLGSDIPASARDDVTAAMALSSTPSAASAAALTDALSDPAIGGSSALALGAQARTLADGDPEAAASAVHELIERYEEATTNDERLLYLNALANSGDPEALPVMRAALAGDVPSLAQAAAYGLRFIPGSEVDDLLADVLAGAPQAVKIQAIRAIGYRDRSVWQARLVEARAADESIDAVREAIDKVLARWK